MRFILWCEWFYDAENVLLTFLLFPVSPSGIVNLAFFLMVMGGTHPRGKTNVVVEPLKNDFDESLKEAARIFWMANTDCLSPSSNMAMVHYCTAEVHGGEYKDKIHCAWDAVGVPNTTPAEPITLEDGVPVVNQSADTGSLQQYILPNVTVGQSVTCKVAGPSGDADLYVRLGGPAAPGSEANECSSTSANSIEQCTTSVATEDTDVYAGVYAYGEYSNLSVECSVDGSSPPPPTGMTLEFGVPMVIEEASAGQVLDYVISDVNAGEVVACSLYGLLGDADLYLDVNGQAVPEPNTPTNDCESYTTDSFEFCLAAVSTNDSWVSVVVEVYTNVSSLTLVCFRLM